MVSDRNRRDHETAANSNYLSLLANRLAANVRGALEMYYLRQSDSHSRSGDINVIGNTLKFRL